MALAGKKDSIVCSAFYPKFGPWYFDKALARTILRNYVMQFCQLNVAQTLHCTADCAINELL